MQNKQKTTHSKHPSCLSTLYAFFSRHKNNRVYCSTPETRQSLPIVLKNGLRDRIEPSGTVLFRNKELVDDMLNTHEIFMLQPDNTHPSFHAMNIGLDINRLTTFDAMRIQEDNIGRVTTNSPRYPDDYEIDCAEAALKHTLQF